MEPKSESSPTSTKSSRPKSESSTTKIFVSTLPFTTTNEQLEEFFGRVGPLKTSFVITKQGKHTGCGYVQYALAADAQKALLDLKRIRFLGQRTLKMDFALRRSEIENRRKAGVSLKPAKSPQELERLAALDLKKLNKKLAIRPAAPLQFKKVLYETLLLSNLPNGLLQKQLYKKVRKFGAVADIKFPLNDDSSNPNLTSGQAHIMYETKIEAEAAIKHLNDHVFKGVTVSCKLAIIEDVPLPKKARLIVRNLAFNCKEENLEKVTNFYNQKVFCSFGKITQCHCPTKDGKSRGFGFVQFENLIDAESAIVAINGQKILNRPVAVDWALGKAEFDRLSVLESQTTANDVESDDISVDEEEETDETVQNYDSDCDEFIEIEDVANSDVDSEDDNVEVSHDQGVKDRAKEDQEDCTLFVRNLSFDTTETMLNNSFSKFGNLIYAKITMDKFTKVSRGTGFVCFLKKQDADKCMEQYIESKRVADQERNLYLASEKTDFKKPQKKDAERSVSVMVPEISQTLAQNSSAFIIDGRFVLLDIAVSRNIATELSHSGKMNQRAQDKRNLYLMREGVIFPESDAAKSLSADQLEKRVSGFAHRKRLISTNPSLFISQTRLSIRNLSQKTTEAQLKNEAKFAVVHFWREVESGKRQEMEREVMEEEYNLGRPIPCSARKIEIKQAKILMDKDRLDPLTKKPRSKGCGFVEFESHADALACLRWLNNNERAFTYVKPVEGETKNLEKVKSASKSVIVEFAIENKLLLKQRTERNSKSKSSEDKKKGDKKDKSGKSVQKKDLKRPRDAEESSGLPEAKKMREGQQPKTRDPKKKSYKDRMDLRKEKRQQKKLGIKSAPVPDTPKKVLKVETPVLKEDIPKKPSKRDLKRVKATKADANFEGLVSKYTKTYLGDDQTKKTIADKFNRWYE